MRNPILIAAVAGMLLLTGCQVWQPGGSVYTADKNAFSVLVPTGWTYTSRQVPKNADLLATKDGIFLQQLLVDHHEIKEPLPHSTRTVTAQMTPFEVAEAVADDLRSDRALLSFNVAENTPANVGGQPGFRLLLQYQTADQLRLSELRYGALIGDRVRFLRFVAPSRHYFERDLATFEETVRSLKLSPPSTK